MKSITSETTLTVRQLKDFIRDLPDNMEVNVAHSGAFSSAYCLAVENMSVAFRGRYILKPDCLMISDKDK